jgi:hypothetical protein
MTLILEELTLVHERRGDDDVFTFRLIKETNGSFVSVYRLNCVPSGTPTWNVAYDTEEEMRKQFAFTVNGRLDDGYKYADYHLHEML